MALGQNHEIHARRFGRNLGVGLVLGFFVMLVFGMTIVKVTKGDQMQAFDHTPRASIVPKVTP